MGLVFILALLAALLWATTNYIDKYMVSRITEGGDYRGLIIVSSLVAGIVLLPISLILTGGKVALGLVPIITIFLAATSYLVATIFYFKALYKNDASLVVAIFNLIPVFGYFFGLIFLGEHLEFHQIIGGLIVIFASVAISFEVGKKGVSRDKLVALLLMTLSSLLFAVYFMLFRVATIDRDFNVVAFWCQIGLAVNGILLFMVVKSYRKSFLDLMMKNGKKVVGLNISNEALNLIANLLVNFAITLAPMAIVQTLNGFQPIFAFLIGMLLTMIRPKVFKEDTRRRIVVQKVACIMISFVGLALLYL